MRENVSAVSYTHLAVIGAAIAIFAVKDLDFYEDVLQSTARADQVRKNKREGKMDFGGGKVRVTSTGIKKGWGANVLFYKHMLEGKRRNRFFISTQAIFLFLINIIFVVIFRISAEGQVLSLIHILTSSPREPKLEKTAVVSPVEVDSLVSESSAFTFAPTY